MAVSTSNKDTCPTACILKNSGCYAENYHLNLHWDKVSSGERGTDYDDFLLQLKALPKGSAFRHNQAGDLVGSSNTINSKALQDITKATKRLQAFTYTHYPVLNNLHNQLAIKKANDEGFTVNLSANNITEVDDLLALKIAPVAVVMSPNSPKVTLTEGGNKIVICPAQTSKKTTCVDCMLCAKPDRSFAIGFIPHGTGAKKAILATNNV